MRKLLIGLLLGTAASIGVRELAGEGRRLRDHCREMMSKHCRRS